MEKDFSDYKNSYNLDNMTPNDEATLDALLTSINRKKELDRRIEVLLSSDNLSDSELFQIKTLQELSGKLTGEVSALQETLKISRKSRGEKEQDVRNFIEKLKQDARRYAENKFQWIFCPKCKTLVSMVWWLDQDADQTIEITCPRKLDGHTCGHKFKVSSSELKAQGGRNYSEIPDTLK